MTSRAAAWACALLLALALPTTAGVEVKEKYVGMVQPADGGAPVPISLAIQEFTSDDDTLELAQLLHAKGHGAFVTDLVGRTVGQLTVGEETFPVNALRFQDTDDGRVVSAVTASPLSLSQFDEGDGEEDFAVGYVELVLDAEGKGQGRLLPSAKIVFNDEGFLEAEGQAARELQIVDVRPAE